MEGMDFTLCWWPWKDTGIHTFTLVELNWYADFGTVFSSTKHSEHGHESSSTLWGIP